MANRRERDEVRRWKELTREELAEAEHLYRQLGSVRKAADAANMSYYGMYYRLIRAGAVLSPPNELTEDDHTLTRLLYCDLGLSYRDMKEALGYESINSIANRILRAGITPRQPTDPYNDEDLLNAEAAYLEAGSYRKAADLLGVRSPSTIGRRLERLAERREQGLLPPAAETASLA